MPQIAGDHDVLASQLLRRAIAAQIELYDAVGELADLLELTTFDPVFEATSAFATVHDDDKEIAEEYISESLSILSKSGQTVPGSLPVSIDTNT